MFVMAAIGEFAPWALTGGGVTIVLGALAWGIQQGKVQVESAEGNVRMAEQIRDQAIQDATSARAEIVISRGEIDELRRIISRLRNRLRENGLDDS